MVVGRAGRRSALPFGPSMVAGALLAVLWGDWAWSAYSSLLG